MPFCAAKDRKASDIWRVQEVGGQLPGHARAHTVDTSRRGSAHYSLRRVEQSQSFNTGFAGALPSFEGSTGMSNSDPVHFTLLIVRSCTVLVQAFLPFIPSHFAPGGLKSSLVLPF